MRTVLWGMGFWMLSGLAAGASLVALPGCMAQIQQRTPEAPPPSRAPQVAAELLDAVAEGDMAKAKTLGDKLKEEDRDEKYGILRTAVREWRETEAPAEELVALDRVIAVAKKADLDDSVGKLTKTRERLAAELEKKALDLQVLIANLQDDLKCDEVAKTAQKLDAIEKATGKSFPAKTEVSKCKEAASRVDAAVAAKKWGDAWEAWAVYQDQLGLRKLDPKTPMAARKSAFATAFQAAIKDASAPKPVSITKLTSRKVLGETPIARLWDDGVRKDAESRVAEVLASLEKSTSWATLTTNAASAGWLAGFLRTAPIAPPPNELEGWYKRAREGKYETDKERWTALEGCSCKMLSTLARTTRGLAAVDFASKADAKAKSNEWVAAANLLHQAESLDKDHEKVVASRKALGAGISAARTKMFDQMRASKTPAQTGKLFDDLTTLDDATKGPGERLDKDQREKFRSVLQGFSKGKQADVYKTVAELDPGSVDYAEEARNRLRVWTREWALKESATRARGQKFVAAEELLVAALKSVPDDSELQRSLDGVKEQARNERSRAVILAFEHGAPATGYVLARLDERMTSEDRDAMLSKYSSEVSEVKDKARIKAAPMPSDDFTKAVATGLSGVGPGWELTPDAAAAQNPDTWHGMVLKLSTKRLANQDARLLKTEQATSKYQSGTKKEANPEKAECEKAVSDQKSKVAMLASTLEAKQKLVAQCKSRTKSAGWLGGALLSAGCDLAGNMVHDLEAARSELSSMETKCNNTPTQIDVPVYAEMPYKIEVWGMDPVADVLVDIDAAGAGKGDLVNPVVTHTKHYEDKLVKGQSQYNIQDDPLSLQGKDEINSSLAEEIRPKVDETFKKAVEEYWQHLEKRAKASNDPEQYARLLVWCELASVNPPPKSSWEDEVRKAIKTPPKGPMMKKK